jgi:hypothetical protein
MDIYYSLRHYIYILNRYDLMIGISLNVRINKTNN